MSNILHFPTMQRAGRHQRHDYAAVQGELKGHRNMFDTLEELAEQMEIADLRMKILKQGRISTVSYDFL